MKIKSVAAEKWCAQNNNIREEETQAKQWGLPLETEGLNWRLSLKKKKNPGSQSTAYDLKNTK